MKKFLGFIALAVLVLLPIRAYAETYGISYTSNGEPDAEGYFTITVKGTQSGGGSLKEFDTTMTLTNVEYVPDSFVGSGDWIGVSQEGMKLTFTASVPVQDSSFTIGTLKFKKVNTAEECKVVFTCNGTTKTVTPDKKTVKNPKTGSALPYAVIGVGIVMAIGVYYVTRRNVKLYKI